MRLRRPIIPGSMSSLPRPLRHRPDSPRRRRRYRGARLRPGQAVHQEVRESRRDQARDLHDRPDDPRGEGLRGQGPSAVPEGDAPDAGRPLRARTSPRSASIRTSSRSRRKRPGRQRRQGGLRRDAGSRPGWCPFPSSSKTRGAPSMGADEIDMVIDRGAFLSGDYAKVASTRSRPSRRRAGTAHLKVILETGELETYDNVRKASRPRHDVRRRLHQDFHGQGQSGRDARRGPRDARGDPGLLLRDGPADRDEAGRRHQDVEAGAPPPRAGQGDARRRLAHAGPVPPRRLDAHERPARCSSRRNRAGGTRARTTSRRTDHGTASREEEAARERAIRHDRSGEAGARVRQRLGVLSRSRVARPRAAEKIGTGSSSAGNSSRRGPKKYFPTINPATEEPLAEVAEGSAADVDAAVRAAEEAHRNRWSKLKPAERGKYIYRIARIMQEKSRELAVIETMDGGKPIKESPRRGHPARRGALLLPRRLGRQARVRVPAPHGLFDRRLRPDHPVELPAARWRRGRSRPRSRAATPWS